MENVENLTKMAIEKEELNIASSIRKDTMLQVFRDNFDLWERELFPLLKLQKKKRYAYLVDLLALADYKISEEQVGLYLSKVRAEKGKRKSYKKVVE